MKPSNQAVCYSVTVWNFSQQQQLCKYTWLRCLSIETKKVVFFLLKPIKFPEKKKEKSEERKTNKNKSGFPQSAQSRIHYTGTRIRFSAKLASAWVISNCMHAWTTGRHSCNHPRNMHSLQGELCISCHFIPFWATIVFKESTMTCFHLVQFSLEFLDVLGLLYRNLDFEHFHHGHWPEEKMSGQNILFDPWLRLSIQ